VDCFRLGFGGVRGFGVGALLAAALLTAAEHLAGHFVQDLGDGFDFGHMVATTQSARV
jgi:hypothetical protein